MSAVIVILANTLLVWAKESYPALKAAMKAAAGHHWTAHSILVAVAFIVLGWILSRAMSRMSGVLLSFLILIAVFAGGVGIVGWFALEIVL